MSVEVGQAMTLAEVGALPAVVDLMTAARALGIRRTTAYALARGGSVSLPRLPGRCVVSRADFRGVAVAGVGHLIQ